MSCALVDRAAEPAVFRCPDCRGVLLAWRCVSCGTTYEEANGIPDLLGRSAAAARFREIGAYYDALYAERTNVWADQGHTPEFNQFAIELVEHGGPGRYLDIGCGEGFFLRLARRMDTFGVDLSREALRRARDSSGASVAIAAAERLPFASGTFDAVSSIGAMEHFLDDRTATLEVRRVLRRGGRYILALLVENTFGDRLRARVHEFLWPRPHAIRLARWVWEKAGTLRQPRAPDALDYPLQPVQNRYRHRHVTTLFESSGFRVTDVISTATHRDAPLPGAYMRFYELEAC
jgi:SAM-dependent methyltransferase